MLQNRLTLPIALILMLVGWAGTASAKTYMLGSGSGAQLQIGGGLPLPIQATNTMATGTMFPALLVPQAPGATVTGTTAVSTGQELVVPAGALSKVAEYKQLGVFGQNIALYAVGTNLGVQWPAETATFNATKRTGPKTFTFTTNTAQTTVMYSNAAADKFGGPAAFAVQGVATGGDFNTLPVTVYRRKNLGAAGFPPCTHPAFGGSDACTAIALPARPSGAGTTAGNYPVGIGLPKSTTTTTTGVPVPNPGTGPVKANAAGTVLSFTLGSDVGLTNAATSTGFPWTTGMVQLKAKQALLGPETWKITGKDSRDSVGSGTIQMVAGSVSNRTQSGPNANRGWVTLRMIPPGAVPAFTNWGLAATSLSMIAIALFVAHRARKS